MRYFRIGAFLFVPVLLLFFAPLDFAHAQSCPATKDGVKVDYDQSCGKKTYGEGKDGPEVKSIGGKGCKCSTTTESGEKIPGNCQGVNDCSLNNIPSSKKAPKPATACGGSGQPECPKTTDRTKGEGAPPPAEPLKEPVKNYDDDLPPDPEPGTKFNAVTQEELQRIKQEQQAANQLSQTAESAFRQLSKEGWGQGSIIDQLRTNSNSYGGDFTYRGDSYDQAFDTAFFGDQGFGAGALADPNAGYGGNASGQLPGASSYSGLSAPSQGASTFQPPGGSSSGVPGSSFTQPTGSLTGAPGNPSFGADSATNPAAWAQPLPGTGGAVTPGPAPKDWTALTNNPNADIAGASKFGGYQPPPYTSPTEGPAVAGQPSQDQVSNAPGSVALNTQPSSGQSGFGPTPTAQTPQEAGFGPGVSEPYPTQPWPGENGAPPATQPPFTVTPSQASTPQGSVPSDFKGTPVEQLTVPGDAVSGPPQQRESSPIANYPLQPSAAAQAAGVRNTSLEELVRAAARPDFVSAVTADPQNPADLLNVNPFVWSPALSGPPGSIADQQGIAETPTGSSIYGAPLATNGAGDGVSAPVLNTGNANPLITFGKLEAEADPAGAGWADAMADTAPLDTAPLAPGSVPSELVPLPQARPQEASIAEQAAAETKADLTAFNPDQSNVPLPAARPYKDILQSKLDAYNTALKGGSAAKIASAKDSFRSELNNSQGLKNSTSADKNNPLVTPGTSPKPGEAAPNPADQAALNELRSQMQDPNTLTAVEKNVDTLTEKQSANDAAWNKFFKDNNVKTVDGTNYADIKDTPAAVNKMLEEYRSLASTDRAIATVMGEQLNAAPAAAKNEYGDTFGGVTPTTESAVDRLSGLTDNYNNLRQQLNAVPHTYNEFGDVQYTSPKDYLQATKLGAQLDSAAVAGQKLAAEAGVQAEQYQQFLPEAQARAFESVASQANANADAAAKQLQEKTASAELGYGFGWDCPGRCLQVTEGGQTMPLSEYERNVQGYIDSQRALAATSLANADYMRSGDPLAQSVANTIAEGGYRGYLAQGNLDQYAQAQKDLNALGDVSANDPAYQDALGRSGYYREQLDRLANGGDLTQLEQDALRLSNPNNLTAEEFDAKLRSQRMENYSPLAQSINQALKSVGLTAPTADIPQSRLFMTPEDIVRQQVGDVRAAAWELTKEAGLIASLTPPGMAVLSPILKPLDAVVSSVVSPIARATLSTGEQAFFKNFLRAGGITGEFPNFGAPTSGELGGGVNSGLSTLDKAMAQRNSWQQILNDPALSATDRAAAQAQYDIADAYVQRAQAQSTTAVRPSTPASPASSDPLALSAPRATIQSDVAAASGEWSPSLAGSPTSSNLPATTGGAVPTGTATPAPAAALEPAAASLAPSTAFESNIARSGLGDQLALPAPAAAAGLLPAPQGPAGLLSAPAQPAGLLTYSPGELAPSVAPTAPQSVITASTPAELSSAVSADAAAGGARAGTALVDGQPVAYEIGASAGPGEATIYSIPQNSIPASAARVSAADVGASAAERGYAPVAPSSANPTVLKPASTPASPGESAAIRDYQSAKQQVNLYQSGQATRYPETMLKYAQDGLTAQNLAATLDGQVYRTSGNAVGEAGEVLGNFPNAGKDFTPLTGNPDATVPQFVKSQETGAWYRNTGGSPDDLVRVTDDTAVANLERNLSGNAVSVERVAADRAAAISRQEAADQAAELARTQQALREYDSAKTAEAQARASGSGNTQTLTETTELERVQAQVDAARAYRDARGSVVDAPSEQALRNTGKAAADQGIGYGKVNETYYEIDGAGDVSPLNNYTAQSSLTNLPKVASSDVLARAAVDAASGAANDALAKLSPTAQKTAQANAAARAYVGPVMQAPTLTRVRQALGGDTGAIARSNAIDAATFQWTPRVQPLASAQPAPAGTAAAAPAGAEAGLPASTWRPTSGGSATSGSRGVAAGQAPATATREMPISAKASTRSGTISNSVREFFGGQPAPKVAPPVSSGQAAAVKDLNNALASQSNLATKSQGTRIAERSNATSHVTDSLEGLSKNGLHISNSGDGSIRLNSDPSQVVATLNPVQFPGADPYTLVASVEGSVPSYPVLSKVGYDTAMEALDEMQARVSELARAEAAPRVDTAHQDVVARLDAIDKAIDKVQTRFTGFEKNLQGIAERDIPTETLPQEDQRRLRALWDDVYELQSKLSGFERDIPALAAQSTPEPKSEEVARRTETLAQGVAATRDELNKVIRNSPIYIPEGLVSARPTVASASAAPSRPTKTVFLGEYVWEPPVNVGRVATAPNVTAGAPSTASPSVGGTGTGATTIAPIDLKNYATYYTDPNSLVGKYVTNRRSGQPWQIISVSDAAKGGTGRMVLQEVFPENGVKNTQGDFLGQFLSNLAGTGGQWQVPSDETINIPGEQQPSVSPVDPQQILLSPLNGEPFTIPPMFNIENIGSVADLEIRGAGGPALTPAAREAILEAEGQRIAAKYPDVTFVRVVDGKTMQFRIGSGAVFGTDSETGIKARYLARLQRAANLDPGMTEAEAKDAAERFGLAYNGQEPGLPGYHTFTLDSGAGSTIVARVAEEIESKIEEKRLRSQPTQQQPEGALGSDIQGTLPSTGGAAALGLRTPVYAPEREAAYKAAVTQDAVDLATQYIVETNAAWETDDVAVGKKHLEEADAIAVQLDAMLGDRAFVDRLIDELSFAPKGTVIVSQAAQSPSTAQSGRGILQRMAQAALDAVRSTQSPVYRTNSLGFLDPSVAVWAMQPLLNPILSALSGEAGTASAPAQAPANSVSLTRSTETARVQALAVDEILNVETLVPENARPGSADTAVVVLSGYRDAPGSSTIGPLSQASAAESGLTTYTIATRPVEVSSEELYRQALAIAQFLSDRGIRNVFIIGHSEGGNKAINLASIMHLAPGASVRGLLLVNAAGLSNVNPFEIALRVFTTSATGLARPDTAALGADLAARMVVDTLQEVLTSPVSFLPKFLQDISTGNTVNPRASSLGKGFPIRVVFATGDPAVVPLSKQQVQELFVPGADVQTTIIDGGHLQALADAQTTAKDFFDSVNWQRPQEAGSAPSSGAAEVIGAIARGQASDPVLTVRASDESALRWDAALAEIDQAVADARELIDAGETAEEVNVDILLPEGISIVPSAETQVFVRDESGEVVTVAINGEELPVYAIGADAASIQRSLPSTGGAARTPTEALEGGGGAIVVSPPNEFRPITRNSTEDVELQTQLAVFAYTSDPANYRGPNGEMLPVPPMPDFTQPIRSAASGLVRNAAIGKFTGDASEASAAGRYRQFIEGLSDEGNEITRDMVSDWRNATTKAQKLAALHYIYADALGQELNAQQQERIADTQDQLLAVERAATAGILERIREAVGNEIVREIDAIEKTYDENVAVSPEGGVGSIFKDIITAPLRPVSPAQLFTGFMAAVNFTPSAPAFNAAMDLGYSLMYPQQIVRVQPAATQAPAGFGDVIGYILNNILSSPGGAATPTNVAGQEQGNAEWAQVIQEIRVSRKNLEDARVTLEGVLLELGNPALEGAIDAYGYAFDDYHEAVMSAATPAEQIILSQRKEAVVVGLRTVARDLSIVKDENARISIIQRELGVPINEYNEAVPAAARVSEVEGSSSGASIGISASGVARAAFTGALRTASPLGAAINVLSYLVTPAQSAKLTPEAKYELAIAKGYPKDEGVATEQMYDSWVQDAEAVKRDYGEDITTEKSVDEKARATTATQNKEPLTQVVTHETSKDAVPGSTCEGTPGVSLAYYICNAQKFNPKRGGYVGEHVLSGIEKINGKNVGKLVLVQSLKYRVNGVRGKNETTLHDERLANEGDALTTRTEKFVELIKLRSYLKVFGKDFRIVTHPSLDPGKNPREGEARYAFYKSLPGAVEHTAREGYKYLTFDSIPPLSAVDGTPASEPAPPAQMPEGSSFSPTPINQQTTAPTAPGAPSSGTDVRAPAQDTTTSIPPKAQTSEVAGPQPRTHLPPSVTTAPSAGGFFSRLGSGLLGSPSGEAAEQEAQQLFAGASSWTEVLARIADKNLDAPAAEAYVLKNARGELYGTNTSVPQAQQEAQIRKDAQAKLYNMRNPAATPVLPMVEVRNQLAKWVAEAGIKENSIVFTGIDKYGQALFKGSSGRVYPIAPLETGQQYRVSLNTKKIYTDEEIVRSFPSASDFFKSSLTKEQLGRVADWGKYSDISPTLASLRKAALSLPDAQALGSNQVRILQGVSPDVLAGIMRGIEKFYKESGEVPTITSLNRTLLQNRDANGATNSDHTVGMAFDVRDYTKGGFNGSKALQDRFFELMRAEGFFADRHTVRGGVVHVHFGMGPFAEGTDWKEPTGPASSIITTTLPSNQYGIALNGKQYSLAADVTIANVEPSPVLPKDAVAVGPAQERTKLASWRTLNSNASDHEAEGMLSDERVAIMRGVEDAVRMLAPLIGVSERDLLAAIGGEAGNIYQESTFDASNGNSVYRGPQQLAAWQMLRVAEAFRLAAQTGALPEETVKWLNDTAERIEAGMKKIQILDKKGNVVGYDIKSPNNPAHDPSLGAAAGVGRHVFLLDDSQKVTKENILGVTNALRNALQYAKGDAYKVSVALHLAQLAPSTMRNWDLSRKLNGAERWALRRNSVPVTKKSTIQNALDLLASKKLHGRNLAKGIGIANAYAELQTPDANEAVASVPRSQSAEELPRQPEAKPRPAPSGTPSSIFSPIPLNESGELLVPVESKQDAERLVLEQRAKEEALRAAAQKEAARKAEEERALAEKQAADKAAAQKAAAEARLVAQLAEQAPVIGDFSAATPEAIAKLDAWVQEHEARLRAEQAAAERATEQLQRLNELRPIVQEIQRLAQQKIDFAQQAVENQSVAEALNEWMREYQEWLGEQRLAQTRALADAAAKLQEDMAAYKQLQVDTAIADGQRLQEQADAAAWNMKATEVAEKISELLAMARDVALALEATERSNSFLDAALAPSSNDEIAAVRDLAELYRAIEEAKANRQLWEVRVQTALDAANRAAFFDGSLAAFQSNLRDVQSAVDGLVQRLQEEADALAAKEQAAREARIAQILQGLDDWQAQRQADIDAYNAAVTKYQRVRDVLSQDPLADISRTDRIAAWDALQQADALAAKIAKDLEAPSTSPLDEYLLEQYAEQTRALAEVDRAFAEIEAQYRSEIQAIRDEYAFRERTLAELRQREELQELYGKVFETLAESPLDTVREEDVKTAADALKKADAILEGLPSRFADLQLGLYAVNNAAPVSGLSSETTVPPLAPIESRPLPDITPAQKTAPVVTVLRIAGVPNASDLGLPQQTLFIVKPGLGIAMVTTDANGRVTFPSFKPGVSIKPVERGSDLSAPAAPIPELEVPQTPAQQARSFSEWLGDVASNIANEVSRTAPAPTPDFTAQDVAQDRATAIQVQIERTQGVIAAIEKVMPQRAQYDMVEAQISPLQQQVNENQKKIDDIKKKYEKELTEPSNPAAQQKLTAISRDLKTAGEAAAKKGAEAAAAQNVVDASTKKLLGGGLLNLAWKYLTGTLAREKAVIIAQGETAVRIGIDAANAAGAIPPLVSDLLNNSFIDKSSRDVKKLVALNEQYRIAQKSLINSLIGIQDLLNKNPDALQSSSLPADAKAAGDELKRIGKLFKPLMGNLIARELGKASSPAGLPADVKKQYDSLIQQNEDLSGRISQLVERLQEIGEPRVDVSGIDGIAQGAGSTSQGPNTAAVTKLTQVKSELESLKQKATSQDEALKVARAKNDYGNLITLGKNLGDTLHSLSTTIQSVVDNPSRFIRGTAISGTVIDITGVSSASKYLNGESTSLLPGTKVTTLQMSLPEASKALSTGAKRLKAYLSKEENLADEKITAEISSLGYFLGDFSKKFDVPMTKLLDTAIEEAKNPQSAPAEEGFASTAKELREALDAAQKQLAILSTPSSGGETTASTPSPYPSLAGSAVKLLLSLPQPVQDTVFGALSLGTNAYNVVVSYGPSTESIGNAVDTVIDSVSSVGGSIADMASSLQPIQVPPGTPEQPYEIGGGVAILPKGPEVEEGELSQEDQVLKFYEDMVALPRQTLAQGRSTEEALQVVDEVVKGLNATVSQSAPVTDAVSSIADAADTGSEEDLERLLGDLARKVDETAAQVIAKVNRDDLPPDVTDEELQRTAREIVIADMQRKLDGERLSASNDNTPQGEQKRGVIDALRDWLKGGAIEWPIIPPGGGGGSGGGGGGSGGGGDGGSGGDGSGAGAGSAGGKGPSARQLFWRAVALTGLWALTPSPESLQQQSPDKPAVTQPAPSAGTAPATPQTQTGSTPNAPQAPPGTAPQAPQVPQGGTQTPPEQPAKIVKPADVPGGGSNMGPTGFVDPKSLPECRAAGEKWQTYMRFSTTFNGVPCKEPSETLKTQPTTVDKNANPSPDITGSVPLVKKPSPDITRKPQPDLDPSPSTTRRPSGPTGPAAPSGPLTQPSVTPSGGGQQGMMFGLGQMLGQALKGAMGWLGFPSATDSAQQAQQAQPIQQQSGSAYAPQTPPYVYLSSSASSVAKGGTVTLTWTSSDAATCSLIGSDGSRLSSDLGGTMQTPSLQTTISYTLECGNAMGNARSAVIVNVTGSDAQNTGAPAAQTQPQSIAPPYVLLGATPSTVQEGERATLSWTSANATYCEVVSQEGTQLSIQFNGSVQTPALQETSSYVLQCSNAAGYSRSVAAVTVVPQEATSTSAQAEEVSALPHALLSADPAVVVQGQRATLTWTAEDADACEVFGSDGMHVNAGNGGTLDTAPLQAPATYTLQCKNEHGYVRSNAAVALSNWLPPEGMYAPPSPVTATPTPAYTLIGPTIVTKPNPSSGSAPAAQNTSSQQTSTPSSSTGVPAAIGQSAPASSGSASSQSLGSSTGPEPFVMASAYPQSVQQEGKATISWSSANASSCAVGASDGSILATGLGGTVETPPITATTEFAVACVNATGGKAFKSLFITVQ